MWIREPDSNLLIYSLFLFLWYSTATVGYESTTSSEHVSLLRRSLVMRRLIRVGKIYIILKYI